MKLTTPKPPIDLLEVLPELADLRATTVRLHPRKGRLPNKYGSKLGGTFLWPSDEPWPVCDERWPPSWTPYVEQGIPVPEDDPRAQPFPLVPVLQLRADDFPEMPFPPGVVMPPGRHPERMKMEPGRGYDRVGALPRTEVVVSLGASSPRRSLTRTLRRTRTCRPLGWGARRAACSIRPGPSAARRRAEGL
jgi:hypothetical protein